ncbi:hypothetical protein GOODEAATRI_008885 [Goodea atripinnis]|uniref:Uncharacterized protein n=1 Tax=Goodea atripinnis TaxID=208336 RepID=A0ABV0NSX2_9TELE
MAGLETADIRGAIMDGLGPPCRAIWLRCTACWDAAASPEPCVAEPDARSCEIGPWLSNMTDRRFISDQSCAHVE